MKKIREFTLKETIAKAKIWSRSQTEYNRIQLIDAYETLNQEQQEQADKIIIKFQPCWA